jgi:ribonuclease E
MKKEMLINVLQPEECRIAIVEDGVLEELYVERTSHESYVGNIYKGRIVNIEPSIQAAFVDFGVGRNGFLHVSDVEPTYYRHLEPRRGENGGPRGRGGRDRHRSPAGRPQTASRDRAPSPEDMPTIPPEDFPEEAQEFQPESYKHSQPPAKRPRRGRRSEGGDLTEQREDQAAPGSAFPIDDITQPEGQPAHSDMEQPEPPSPRLMDSADRRTDEDDPSTAPLQSEPVLTDEEVFFPREGVSDAGQEPARRSVVDADVLEHAWQDGAHAADIEEPAERPLEEDQPRHDKPKHAGAIGDDEVPPAVRHRRGREGYSGGRGRRGSGLGRGALGRPKPLIQDIFRRGQEVLVQVIKEGIGTKGPTLSTYISIAGRYLVLMPGLNRIGVSRKIADDEQRRRLREILNELHPPKGLGFIIRTAGLDKNKKELQRDLAYLSRLWQVVVRRIRKMKAPAEIYQESDMITRTIRDTFTSEIDTIWVDETAAFEHAQEFLQIVMPRYASRIKLYNEPEPLFHRYGIEDEIARIQQRHVPLPSGGSIVIEQTEALVAIDVNSGNFRADNNAEETAYQMNLHAAKEIARQLRLRDLGGVIVNDFIDMRDDKHRRGVERALREAVKRDRARTKILKISAFGIIEMTRQRIRPSLKRSVYQDCAHCRGTGQVKTCESMSIDVMRMLQLAAHRDHIHRIQVSVAEEVAHYLLNKKRKEISRLEESAEIQVSITAKPGASPEMLEFACYDNNNNEIKFFSTEERMLPRH